MDPLMDENDNMNNNATVEGHFKSLKCQEVPVPEPDLESDSVEHAQHEKNVSVSEGDSTKERIDQFASDNVETDIPTVIGRKSEISEHNEEVVTSHIKDEFSPEDNKDGIAEYEIQSNAPGDMVDNCEHEVEHEVGNKENKSISEAKTKEDENEVEEIAKGYIIIDGRLPARSHKDCILEPLSFPEYSTKVQNEVSKEQHRDSDDAFEDQFAPNMTPCMMCDNMYEDVEKKEQHDEYLCHLVVEHKMVIADVKLIANLRKYAIYWKRRFAMKAVEEYCASINTNTSPKDQHETEKYYLLCDALPEDREIRERMQLQKLKELTIQQTEERENPSFERMCLFCTKFFIGNRDQLFAHLNEDHNFNVGHPHNLIHIDEFLNEIEKKLNGLVCLFCEKTGFKDRASLREHMRKKSHRRLNPKNKLYDKYYIINYLELGKNWEVLQGEPEQFETPEDWTGWDEEGQTAVCFFCSSSFNAQDLVYDHMRTSHDFDFPKMRKDMNLSFYQQVKMINYIRREVHQNKELEKKDEDDLSDESKQRDVLEGNADHIVKHIKETILTNTKWNQPQYYFPTYENDTLLCQLEDKEGLFEPEDTFIIGEDGIDCKAIINESVLTDLVVGGYFD